MHLDVKVRIPGADQAKFDEAAQNAKKGCPVSRVLNANITMDAKLVYLILSIGCPFERTAVDIVSCRRLLGRG